MIPDELRALPQWVSAGLNKIPLNPKTGKFADVRNPDDWGTYEEAASRGPLVGFVLSEHDPYSVIDVDAPQTPEQEERARKILSLFGTYAETSVSGNGVHIWTRGTIPRGVKRDRVEVYSAGRYMICTGHKLPGRTSEITEQQTLLNALYDEMALEFDDLLSELHEGEELLTDAALVDMASAAVNGEKFDRLCGGQWEGEYQSQSEADFALMAIIAFYTRSNEQAMRLFRMTGLGKRDKAQRDEYLKHMLKKIRAKEPERIDFSSLKEPRHESTNGIPPVAHSTPVRAVPSNGVEFPPGFAGDIARYIYESATRPVKEVGIAAAISLCAGIVGRQFNISGTGLNLYVILLAKTGVGKEAGPQGIDRLVTAVRATVPLVDDFIGPGTFASGQGLIRTLDDKPCFVSVFGEFGLMLQMLSDARANPTTIALRRSLLDLYSKSGRSGTLRSTAYSDKDKDTKTVLAPALTIYGESTPETFYGGLSQSHIADGLVPRFLILEYEGDRSDRNPTAFAQPDGRLVQQLANLVSTVLTMANNQSWADVRLGDGARDLMDAFDVECDKEIRGGGSDAIRQVWNRAHLKALRLAGVLAVADRINECTVNEAEAKWAIDLVRRDVQRVTERFESGDIGEGETKQMSDMERIISDYFEYAPTAVKKYAKELPNVLEMRKKRVIPQTYISRRANNLVAFKNAKPNSRVAIKEAINDLVLEGRLQEVPKQQMKEMFSTAAAGYFVKEEV